MVLINVNIVCVLIVGMVVSRTHSGDAPSTNVLKILNALSQGKALEHLEAYVTNERKRLRELKSKLKNYRWKKSSSKLNNESVDDQQKFHPIRALHAVKSLSHIHELAHERAQINYMYLFNSLLFMQTPSMPGGLQSLDEGLHGFRRIIDFYGLHIGALVDGVIMESKTGSLLDSTDLARLGYAYFSSSDFNKAALLFGGAVYRSLEEANGNVTRLDEFAFQHFSMLLSQLGENAIITKLQSKLNSKTGLSPMRFRSLTRDLFSRLSVKPDCVRSTATLDSFMRMCRGLGLRPKRGPLICQYRRGALNPLVRYAEEEVHDNPRIVMLYDVISDKEATQFHYSAYDNELRAQSVGGRVWLTDEYTVSLRLSQRLHDATGLDNALRLQASSAEPYVVTSYGLGEDRVPAIDAVPKDKLSEEPLFLSKSGNRFGSFIIFLTQVAKGGDIMFPRLDLKVAPKKNAALFWHTLRVDGRVNPLVENGECPTILGEKWVVRKHIREMGLWRSQPDGVCKVTRSILSKNRHS